MKVYEVTHTICNKQGRLISTEVYPIAFNTESEMSEYMKSKWAMAENNESYVAVEIQG